MDYQEKYLKYKSKYYDIKYKKTEQCGGRDKNMMVVAVNKFKNQSGGNNDNKQCNTYKLIMKDDVNFYLYKNGQKYDFIPLSNLNLDNHNDLINKYISENGEAGFKANATIKNITEDKDNCVYYVELEGYNEIKQQLSETINDVSKTDYLSNYIKKIMEPKQEPIIIQNPYQPITPNKKIIPVVTTPISTMIIYEYQSQINQSIDENLNGIMNGTTYVSSYDIYTDNLIRQNITKNLETIKTSFDNNIMMTYDEKKKKVKILSGTESGLKFDIEKDTNNIFTLTITIINEQTYNIMGYSDTQNNVHIYDDENCLTKYPDLQGYICDDLKTKYNNNDLKIILYNGFKTTNDNILSRAPYCVIYLMIKFGAKNAIYAINNNSSKYENIINNTLKHLFTS